MQQEAAERRSPPERMQTWLTANNSNDSPLLPSLSLSSMSSGRFQTKSTTVWGHGTKGYRYYDKATDDATTGSALPAFLWSHTSSADKLPAVC